MKNLSKSTFSLIFILFFALIPLNASQIDKEKIEIQFINKTNSHIEFNSWIPFQGYAFLSESATVNSVFSKTLPAKNKEPIQFSFTVYSNSNENDKFTISKISLPLPLPKHTQTIELKNITLSQSNKKISLKLTISSKNHKYFTITISDS